MRGIIITQSVTEHNPVLDRYLNEIGKYDLLSAEDEAVLSEKIRNGDVAAKNKLVNANLRFVVSVAKKYQNMGLALADLISEGNMGLIKAAGLFDGTKGFKFISFAVWWIRQSIMHAIDEKRRVMRLPVNVILGINKIRQKETELEQILERMPTTDELSEAMGVPESKVADHLWHSGFTLSLDKGIDMESGKEGSLMDMVENKEAVSSDEEVLRESVSIELQRLLEKLHDRERLIVKLCYGIGQDHSMEMEDVALKLGLSKERVRQIRAGAVRKMKLMMNSDLFY